MNIPIEFVALFLGVAIAACGWMIKYLVNAVNLTNASLQTMNAHLGLLNGRMGKSETWQTMHEGRADERHQQLEREQTRLWTAIDRGGARS